MDPVILDFGSLTTKIGVGGDADPYKTFPTVVSPDGTVGQDAINKRTSDNGPIYPINRGFVNKWEQMENIYDTSFKLLNPITNDNPTQRTIVLATPPLASRLDREKHAQLLFEKYQVPSLTMVNTAELSLYHVGKSSGLVVDIGHGVVSVVPIWDKNIFNHAIRRNEVAGIDVETFLVSLVHNRQSIDIETARQMKERSDGFCYVAADLEKEAQKDSQEIDMDFELPDGKKITLGRERFLACEALFDPEYMDRDVPSLQKLIQTAVTQCDINVRKSLYENIQVAGGLSLLSGLESRLHAELTKLVPASVKVQLHANKDRHYAAWIGGSVISQLSTFNQMLVTKNDYMELGDSLINERYKN
jgi:actin-related protein